MIFTTQYILLDRSRGKQTQAVYKSKTRSRPEGQLSGFICSQYFYPNTALDLPLDERVAIQNFVALVPAGSKKHKQTNKQTNFLIYILAS